MKKKLKKKLEKMKKWKNKKNWKNWKKLKKLKKLKKIGKKWKKKEKMKKWKKWKKLKKMKKWKKWKNEKNWKNEKMKKMKKMKKWKKNWKNEKMKKMKKWKIEKKIEKIKKNEKMKKKWKNEKIEKMEKMRKYVPLLLPGWMEWPRRALGKCEVLTLLTASGRSDQSHRLAPCQHHSILMPTKPTGRVGRAKKNTTHSRKGALTTARPLLVNARLTGETCAKNFADTCYTASGSRAESQPQPKKHIIKAKWTSGSQNALHIFSQARIEIHAP